MSALCGLLGSIANATPTFAWARVKAGTTPEGFDYSIGAKSDSAGNVYVVNNVYNGASPNDFQDIQVVKYNSGGTEVWTQTINLHGFDDRAYDMDVDSAGNVYIVGFTSLDDFLTDTNVIAVKMNTSGVVQYTFERVPVSNNKDEYAYACALDSANNLIVVGETPSGSGTFQFDCLAVKLNSTGVVQWTYTASGSNAPGYDALDNVTVLSTNDVVVGGQVSNSATADDQDAFVARLNGATGVASFTNSYNSALGSSTDVVTDVAVDTAGNAYAVGVTVSAYSPVMLQRGFIRKFTSGGAVSFTTTFNGSGTGRTWFNGIVVDALQNAYVCGETMTGTDDPTFNMLVVKYNSAGAQTASNTWNGTAGDEDRGTGILFDGSNVLVAGTTDKDTLALANDRDAVIVEFTQASLTQGAVLSYNNVSDWDVVADFKKGNDGALFVAGNTYVTFSDSNAFAAKFSTIAQINPFNYNIITGVYFGGALSDLFNSDNSYLFILNDESGPNANIEIYGTSPSASPSGITCKLETSATRSDLSQFTDVYKFAGAGIGWVNKNVRTSSTSDDLYQFALTGTLSEFVGPSNEIRMRIRWFPNEDLIAEDGWSETIDQSVWLIN